MEMVPSIGINYPQHLKHKFRQLSSHHLPGFIQGKPRKGKAESPTTVQSVTLRYHQVLHIPINQTDSTWFT